MIRCLFFFISLSFVQGSMAQTAVDPLLKTSLEKNTAIPGQPLLYRVTVLVPTWLPTPPIFPSFEVPNVMVRLPSRASGPTSETIDGETWSGVSRAYRLYPMIPGHFQIPARSIKVTFADPETRQPIETEVKTQAFEIIGETPSGAANLNPFIAAKNLKLERQMEGNSDALQTGGALTVTTTVTITGVSPMFIPPLATDDSIGGVSFYPKEPIIAEKEDRGLPSGSRSQEVTIVGEAAGTYEIPEYSLSWFNLDSGQVETATVPSLSFTVIEAPGAVEENPPSLDWHFFLQAALTIVIFLMAFVFLGRRLWPMVTESTAELWRIFRSSETYAYLGLRREIRRRDLKSVDHVGARWRALSKKLDPDLDWTGYDAALADLGRQFYNKRDERRELIPEESWRNLLRAIRSLRRQLRHKTRSQKRVNLPPLNPPKQAG